MKKQPGSDMFQVIDLITDKVMGTYRTEMKAMNRIYRLDLKSRSIRYTYRRVA